MATAFTKMDKGLSLLDEADMEALPSLDESLLVQR